MKARLIKFFNGRSNSFILLSGFLLVLLLGTIDYLGGDLSFLIFYLVPVSMVTWFVGRKAGFFISTVSAVIWMISDVTGVSSYQHPVISYWNAIVKVGFFFVFTYILAALKEVYDQEKTRSRTDYLTGIANRRFFFEQAEIELKRARRYNHPLTVVYIDVDDFKRVNDRFGHDVGDAVLCVAAGTVNDHLRLIDVVARLGGDEFAILLPETGYDASRRVIDKLQEGLRGRMQKEGWPITFSIGAVSYVKAPESIDEMLKRADSLMYSVKKNSKNTIRHDRVGDRGTEFFIGG